MKILINASNLKVGGGVQVADSICRELIHYPQHHFIVVLSSALQGSVKILQSAGNVEVVCYDLPHSPALLFTGRNSFLDHLVSNYGVQAVLTVFGPSLWIPKCLHVSGFARPHLVIPDSPYWQMYSRISRWKHLFRRRSLRRAFDKASQIYFTENPFISIRLKEVFPKKRVYTVTNNYNQIFDHPDQWEHSVELPPFDGFTLLTVSANYPHKNLKIIRPVISYLRKYKPDFMFRFVLTLTEEQFGAVNEEERKHIVFLGPVSIDSCPHLYEQSDAMFLPTLLECFSASYAEAMKMERPILTSDLEFAHSLCRDAACYFDALSPDACAESIYKLATDPMLYQTLIEKGKEQILRFDTSAERARKLIEIVEKEYQSL